MDIYIVCTEIEKGCVFALELVTVLEYVSSVRVSLQ